MGFFGLFSGRPTATSVDQCNAESDTTVAAKAVSDIGETLQGKCSVIDGDTIVIDNIQVRIAGIDAPELDQPWGKKAKSALIGICRDQVITAHISDALSKNRVVATCILADGRDLAAEIVRRGLALDWPAYSNGKYRHFETPDARRKMWRSVRKQEPEITAAS